MTKVTLPNGMLSVYNYNIRGGLGYIIHSRGGWDFAASYFYSYDAGNNITQIIQTDNGVESTWAYGYDGRSRLTSAVRNDSDSTVTATYAYTYDLADNLLSKSEPFLEDFEDGNYTGWSASAGWSAAGGMMAESSDAWIWFYRANTDPDFDLRFRYSTSDTAAGRSGGVYLRRVDSDNYLVLTMQAGSIALRKREAGVGSDLVSSPSTSVADTWYNVRVLLDGADCTVWRSTGDGGMEQVLSTSSAPFASSTGLYFYSAENSSFRYDDIQVIGSSLANTGTTFGYNAGNELTRATFGGVDTDYAYDAWGRMTQKSRGSYTASYSYGQGDKLTRVASGFPGEGSVTYAYGGDGKRRERNDGIITKYNWDRGWNVLNEEDSSGALTLTVIGRLADISGSSPSAATIRFIFADHLASLRAIYASNAMLLGGYEYTPYGEDYLHSGAAATRKFTGHDWDNRVGLYFAPYRYYYPATARWITRDPLGMKDGPNCFTYASNSPILHIDPLGLTWDVPTEPSGPSRRLPGETMSACMERVAEEMSDIEWWFVSGDCALVCGIGGVPWCAACFSIPFAILAAACAPPEFYDCFAGDPENQYAWPGFPIGIP